MTLERWLLALTPAVVLAVMAMGLRFGARDAQDAAMVYLTHAPAEAPVRVLTIVVLREEAGTREPVTGSPITVETRGGEVHARCDATTNEDGVAECVVPVGLPSRLEDVMVTRTGGALLALGEPVELASDELAAPDAPWLPSVRRDGDVVIDAVMSGARAAPGFPATVWARARDRDTQQPLAHASLELEGDASFTPPVARATTDTRGWAALTVTPLGLAVTATLRARARRGGPGGAEILGEWVGPFPIAPGAARLDTRARWSQDAAVELDLSEPIAWRDAYVEIDDARGRAWAATVSGGVPRSDGTVLTGLHPPSLAPGLYWAVASAAPFTVTEGEGRTAYKPFFVASSDEAALHAGTEPEVCAVGDDPRETAAALGPCLALAARPRIARWLALDGFEPLRKTAAARRSEGLCIALGALFVGGLLEAVLLLGGAARARVRIGEDAAMAPGGSFAGSRPWLVLVTVLIALLGFLLLAGFISRAS